MLSLWIDSYSKLLILNSVKNNSYSWRIQSNGLKRILTARTLTTSCALYLELGKHTIFIFEFKRKKTCLLPNTKK